MYCTRIVMLTFHNFSLFYVRVYRGQMLPLQQLYCLWKQSMCQISDSQKTLISVLYFICQGAKFLIENASVGKVSNCVIMMVTVNCDRIRCLSTLIMKKKLYNMHLECTNTWNCTWRYKATCVNQELNISVDNLYRKLNKKQSRPCLPIPLLEDTF